MLSLTEQQTRTTTLAARPTSGHYVKLKHQTMRYFFDANKPLLETLIEHFAIKGLSWKCTKIEYICLRKN